MRVLEQPPGALGRRLPKRNAIPLVLGKGAFATDLSVPGMLWAKVLRSPHPHARILGIDTEPAARIPGVKAIVTAADVVVNVSGASVRDRPLLAAGVVRCVGEPVAAVAAIDEATAAAAVAAIRVTYDELPAVFDVRSAVAADAPVLHPAKNGYFRLPTLAGWFTNEPGNTSLRFKLKRGDAERAFATAPHVYASRFTTQPQAHVCLEPHAALVRPEPGGRLTVWCTTGKPFRILPQICAALGIDGSRVNVISTDVGGDFGSKAEASIEAICALLARKSGLPVKGVLTRDEVFLGTAHRIASEIDVKLAVGAQGDLQALDLRFVYDVGPYDGYGSMVTVWAAVCAAGPYDIPNVTIDGCSVYTNNLRAGAFRGFGNPQVTFARESLLDVAAKDLGFDPIDFRLRNAWHDGSVTVTDQVLASERNGLGFAETLHALRDRFPAASDRPVSEGVRRRGVGYASGFHGSGYGCLTAADSSSAIVKLNTDGTMTLLTGASDVGQGATTALAQLVAETLGVDTERIILPEQTTDTVPFDGGASASHTVYISGGAAVNAARRLRERILHVAGLRLGAPAGDLAIVDGVVAVRDDPKRSVTFADLSMFAINVHGEQLIEVGAYALRGSLLTPDGKGSPITAYLFASQRAEVEVDLETGVVRVLSLAGAHDVGRAVNPTIVEGQIEGGLVQGLGYALTEDVRQAGGVPLHTDLAHYLIPTAADAPEITAIVVEVPEPTGPHGAKGVGEAGLVPTAPAIANAVASAIGVRITSLPITPEKILAALAARAEPPRIRDLPDVRL